jgi:hypothetical protein
MSLEEKDLLSLAMKGAEYILNHGNGDFMDVVLNIMDDLNFKYAADDEKNKDFYGYY